MIYLQIDYDTHESCSYSRFFDSIKNIGAALYANGLRKGDVVFYTSTNCIKCLLFNYGVISIGGVVATCNPIATQGNYYIDFPLLLGTIIVIYCGPRAEQIGPRICWRVLVRPDKYTYVILVVGASGIHNSNCICQLKYF